MAFRSSTVKLSLFSPHPSLSLRLRHLIFTSTAPPPRIFRYCSISTVTDVKNKAKKEKRKKTKNLKASTSVSKSSESSSFSSKLALVKEKRRTRSTKEFDENAIQFGDTAAHIPVMLAEVLDVFSSSSGRPLRSFVDCTVGAGGHSSAVSHSLNLFSFLFCSSLMIDSLHFLLKFIIRMCSRIGFLGVLMFIVNDRYTIIRMFL